jgi:hypothetical protein
VSVYVSAFSAHINTQSTIIRLISIIIIIYFAIIL